MERIIVQGADFDKFADYKYYYDTIEDTDAPGSDSVLNLWNS